LNLGCLPEIGEFRFDDAEEGAAAALSGAERFFGGNDFLARGKGSPGFLGLGAFFVTAEDPLKQRSGQGNDRLAYRGWGIKTGNRRESAATRNQGSGLGSRRQK
jgi:hypothetical protein